MQPLGFACDAVENLTGTRCLDRTLRYGNDLVRAALKETATDSTLLTGSKGSGGLMAKTARRRIFARVAQGDTHATNRDLQQCPHAHKAKQSSSIAACLAASCFL